MQCIIVKFNTNLIFLFRLTMFYKSSILFIFLHSIDGEIRLTNPVRTFPDPISVTLLIP